MLTDGGSHALDLVCRLLLEPGDTVVLDDPCYFNFQALLRAPCADRQRPVHAERPRSRALRASARRASAAPVHHQLGAAQPDRRDARGARRAPAADARGRTWPADRRGRHLRGFRACPHRASRPSTGCRGSCRSAASRRRCRPRSAAATSPRAGMDQALVDLKLATSFGHAQIGANVVHRLLVDGTYRRHVDSLRAPRGRDGRNAPARHARRGSGRSRAAACSCGRSCPTNRRRTRRAPCAGPRRGARAR